MSDDLVSVVIPMYNSANTIVKALDSIKNQTQLNSIKEVIIVNDGSSDSSEKIVKKYSLENELPIKLINQKNMGVSAARNKGMEQVTSKWIALLDSDDQWLPHKIEYQMNILNRDDIDFLGGAHTDKDLKVLFKKIDGLYKAKLNDLCIKSFPQTSTAIFKTKIFKEVGGYDENQMYAEDLKFFMKICIDYNYYYDSNKVVLYGEGKRGFGESGLSANVKEMYKGNKKNIKDLYENKKIGFQFYYFLQIFYFVKHVRRILIIKRGK